MRLQFKFNDKILRRMENVFKDRPYFAEMLPDSVNDIQENINSEGQNLDMHWNRSQRAMKDGGTTLRDDGQLYSSLHSEIVFVSGDPELWVMSNREVYAKSGRTSSDVAQIHHEGLFGNPRRPFFQFSEGFKFDLQRTLEKEFKL